MNFISKYIFKTQFDNAHTPLVGLMLTFRHKKNFAICICYQLRASPPAELRALILFFLKITFRHKLTNKNLYVILNTSTPLRKGKLTDSRKVPHHPHQWKALQLPSYNLSNFSPQNPDKITRSYPEKMSKSFGDAQRTILVSTENMLAHPHSHYYLSSLDKSILKSF